MEKIKGYGDFGEILFEVMLRDDMKNSVLGFFLPKAKTEKGGPGSGHHDHAGLAGVWGGSSRPTSSGGASAVGEARPQVARPVSSGKISETHSVGLLSADEQYEAFHSLQDDMVSLGVLDKKAGSVYGDLGDDTLNHAREMIVHSLRLGSDAEEGEYCYAVRDEKGRLVAVSTFTRLDEQGGYEDWDHGDFATYAREHGENNIYFAMVGSFTQGSGLLAIKEALSMASDNGLGIITYSAHGDKFTGSMLERFGIVKGETMESESTLGGSKKRAYQELYIPPDSIEKMLAMVERWL